MASMATLKDFPHVFKIFTYILGRLPRAPAKSCITFFPKATTPKHQLQNLLASVKAGLATLVVTHALSPFKERQGTKVMVCLERLVMVTLLETTVAHLLGSDGLLFLRCTIIYFYLLQFNSAITAKVDHIFLKHVQFFHIALFKKSFT